jgi:hypothetical protein
MIDTLVKNIMNLDHSVLSVAVISTRGETLASRTKFNIHDIFGMASDKTKTRRDRIIDGDAGVWIRAALEMTKQFDRVFGGSDALVTFYKEVKLVILPIDCMNIHVVIICLRSTNTEVIIIRFNELLKALKKMDVVA